MHDFQFQHVFGTILTQNSYDFLLPGPQQRPKRNLRDTPESSKESKDPTPHRCTRALQEPWRNPKMPPLPSAPPELFRFPKAPQETFQTPQCPSPRSRFYFQPFRSSQLFQSNPAIPQSCNHPSLRQRNVWSDSSRNFILGFPLELMTSIRISGFIWGIASVAPNTTLFGTAYADLTQKSIFGSLSRFGKKHQNIYSPVVWNREFTEAAAPNTPFLRTVHADLSREESARNW